jgi:chromosome segregation ATPase
MLKTLVSPPADSCVEIAERGDGGAVAAAASFFLEFVQYSAFRRTTHLALEFRRGTDDAVKRYLASRWDEERALRAAAEERCAEAQRKVEELTATSQATETRFSERERRENQRAEAAEAALREANEAKTRLASDVRDLTGQLHTTKVEAVQRDRDLAAVQAKARSAAAEVAELTKKVAQREAQIATLQEQLRASEERAGVQAESLARLEREAPAARADAKAAEEHVLSLKREIRKGNAAIQQLQAKLVACSEDLRTAEEQVTCDRQAAAITTKELAMCTQRAERAEVELAAARAEVESFKAKVAAMAADQERSATRIDYLSRQLTTMHLGATGVGGRANR